MRSLRSFNGALIVAAVALATSGATARGLARPSLFRIELQPTPAAPSAQGVVTLEPAESPFGIALTPDGHFIFDLELRCNGLPAASTFGPYTQYVAWVVTADLSTSQKLGVASTAVPVKGQVAMNKFLVIVSAEGATIGDRWKGPIVLRGFSPSALLENFSGKTMFNGGMPQ
ncbi:MAG: hypothetical protein ABJD07_15225 [Gemmatimonadaceae bacterium]